jgi:protein AIR1/2
MALNKEQERVKDPAFLGKAWGLWLETHTRLRRAARRYARLGPTEANLNSDKIQEMFSEALETDLQSPWIDPPTETEQPESIKSEQQSDGQPESNKSTPQGNLEMNGWTLPPPQSSSEFRVRQKDRASMEEKFVGWCKSLIQLNESTIKVRTPRDRNRVTDAYSRWIGTVDGLTKVKAAAARRAAWQYSQDNSALLAAVFASTAPASGPPAAKSTSSPQEDSGPPPIAPPIAPPITPPIAAVPNGGSNQLVDRGDTEYRERYFPGVGPEEAFCSMCASRGHDAVACPGITCRFCRDPQHRSFSCPTRRRCTKCKQLGHVKKDCTEKLALPKEEVECAFCQSRDHADASCHELWRSFLFQPDTVRKVRSLPVFCYCCGHQGHHGAVCGLNPEKPKEGPWDTWTQANCDRYLDPASSELAIVYESSAGQGSSSERPDLGKSIVPKRHIFFEEADDDDEAEDFIRPPVQKSARVGHISFSGSNGGVNRGGGRPNQQHNDRNGRSGFTQPPLPPGPPPPLPPHEYRRNGGGGGGGGGGGRRRGGGGARY